ncbi:MAG: Rrf2 family transcriptional regulator [Gemmatimonadota bacterium]
MLSQTAEYALRAMVHLARRGTGAQPAQADEIAEALGVPRNYLSKILHALTRGGLLESTRGRRGGFQVAGDPTKLPLARIVEVFEPEFLAGDRRCLLGRPVCRDEQACPAHSQWKVVSDALRDFFQKTSLADLGAPEEGEPPVSD